MDTCLFQDSPKSPLRHVTRMVGHCSISICQRVEADFVAAGGVTVEEKSVVLQPGHDFSI